FKLEKWLNSFSTNLKAGAGGFKGRALQNDDVLLYENDINLAHFLQDKDFILLPWKAFVPEQPTHDIECIIGSEWHLLTNEAKALFQSEPFQISNNADRMGYRLTGEALALNQSTQLLSSAVSFGAIQLLPSGQLMLL